MHLSILSRAWQTLMDFIGGKCSGSGDHLQNTPQSFTFSELSSATKKFRPDLFIDEQCFAKIYKGTLHHNKQLVAIKQSKPTEEIQQSHKRFLAEVLMLNLLHHENIIKLLGYCQAENQRLLVLEKAALHSLKNYLFRSSRAKNKSNFKPLDWSSRIKIALGVAKGLEYLHHKVSPPVIHRDLQTSSIMLAEDLTPKISNFEFAKLGPIGNGKQITTKVVGTSGFAAPEYVEKGLVSVKLDVYSFGFVLLELITGRRVSDLIIHICEGYRLASWVEALTKDTKKSIQMADPQLKGEFQVQEVSKMFQLVAMCLREESEHRPSAIEVVAVLSSLSVSSDSEIQV